MASYEKFQTDEDKYKNSANVFKRQSKGKRKETKSEIFWDNFEYYITYYRNNPHRFCMEYFGMQLYWWQQLVLFQMWFKGNCIFLASRGIGKTYLTMIYCIAKCVLYPGTIIRVAAANKKQAALLLKKIYEIQRNYPLVAKEISDISIAKDEARILLHGGSEIATVVAGDGARGERAQIIIIDEREQVDKEIIDKIFIPFLTATRNPPYLKYQEYSHLKQLETNHFIELSSIGSKTSSLYLEFELYLSFIRQDSEDYCTFCLPYQFGLQSGVITKKTIEKMLKESTTSIEAFKQEMEVIPTGDNESSMFRYEDLNRSRKNYIPLIPITDEEYLQYRGHLSKYPYYQKKDINEVRFISMDVALMGGRQNDQSVFTVFRLTQNGDEYIKEIAYIEAMNGMNVEPQVLRFKQLFYDLECDYAALDCGGLGQTLFDLCTKKTIDPVRGTKYPAWKSRNDEEKMNIRALEESAESVLFTIKVSGAGASEVHANMIARSRLNFERKKVMLLKHEDDVVDILNKRFDYLKLKSSTEQQDNDLATRLILPYYQTTKLIDEAVNTQIIKMPSGGYKIDEKNGRKDRVMSMLYGFYFIDLLEQDLQYTDAPVDYTKLVVASGGNNKNRGMFGTGFAGFQNRSSGFGSRR